jgi:hypothetical protein
VGVLLTVLVGGVMVILLMITWLAAWLVVWINRWAFEFDILELDERNPR